MTAQSQPPANGGESAGESDENNSEYVSPIKFDCNDPRDDKVLNIFRDIFEKSDMKVDGGVVDITMSDIKSVDESMVEPMFDDPEPFLYNATVAARQHFDERGVDANLIGEDEHRKRLVDLRTHHIGELVTVDVTVTDRTKSVGVVRRAVWDCGKCGQYTYIRQSRQPGKIEKPIKCSGYDCSGGSYRLNHGHSEERKIDRQQLIVQDRHKVTDSADPADMLANVYGGHVDMVEAGDTVTVTAIVRDEKNEEKKSKRFLHVVGIEHQDEDYTTLDISDDTIDWIQELSNSSNVHSRLAASIAPTGEGDYHLARMATLLQLFGGVTKTVGENRQRGDIHMAFVGDPSTFKSTIAEYASLIAPKSEETTGEGASEAGLLAAATREGRFETEEWTLSGGALVNASGGLCLVDELDKAPKSIQSALQTPLSKQKIEIDKVISATLPAECSVLLVANPDGERFNLHDPLDEQIDIMPALFSRMDIIVPFVDVPEEDHDKNIGNSIFQTSDDDLDYIPPEKMRKYIAYARQNFDPVIPEDVADYLSEQYAELRSESTEHRIAVDTRTAEGMRRLSEASARVRLSDEVSIEDAERAVDLMTEWMDMLMTDENGQYDIDRASSGPSNSQRERYNTLWEAVDNLADERGVVERDKLLGWMVDEDIDKQQAQQDINKFAGAGEKLMYGDESGTLVDLR